jgi:AP-1-like transcription factor
MNNMVFNNPLSFEMYSYNNNPSAFYTMQHGRIPVEYTGSSTLDERDRRRRRTGSSSSSKDKEVLPNMHLVRPVRVRLPGHLLTRPQRRRAQNRASQRAFRERKERHVKGLEHQLEDLHEKHQELLQSYSRKADEVTKLNARIQELNSEIDSLRTSSELSFSDFLTPEKFDAVPGSDMYYSGPECYFDKNAVDLNSEFALSQLEDTL